MAGEDTPRDERTEEATPRKREDAREKGQVAQSQELVAALMLAAALGSLIVAGGAVAESAGRLTVASLTRVGADPLGSLDAPGSAALLVACARELALPLLLFVAPMLAVGALAAYGQTGFRVTPKALELDWKRLDPLKGAQRMLGARGAVRVGLALLKLAAIVAAMATAVAVRFPDIVRIADGELRPSLRAAATILALAVAGALAAIVAISLLDLLFQRWQHDRDLRMTKQEVKEDMKNSEGDPHLKARVRQLQRELASRRMMEEVPKATVVVTNPTHYAVALRYELDAEDGERFGAPRVVAKGVDLMAQRIKGVARDNGVPCYEDVPLARSLYARAEVGQEVPSDLYEAVATVISFVYRTRRGRRAVARADA